MYEELLSKSLIVGNLDYFQFFYAEWYFNEPSCISVISKIWISPEANYYMK